MAPARSPADVLDLIARLVRRPGRTDRRLPLIWLSGREHGTGVLDGLAQGLRIPRQYLVPHAREKANDPDNNVRPLLKKLCTTLAEPQFGGQRLRFRHYELAEWLMRQDLSELGPEDRGRKIVTLLRGRHRPFRGDDNEPGGNELDLGPQYRLPIWLIRRVVPEVFFRAAVSGRIPGFGRRYRWFMGQQYLAPLQSVDFLGFAERLTKGARQPEDTDQVDKLLVHAFLHDLWRAYSRRPWRLEGWQRTAYPVVLIDNAAERSDGHRLLQLINDVRNETGRSDPLLVVCSSDDEVPQAPTRPHPVEPDPGELRHSDPAYRNPVYKEWAEALPGSRRARVHTAWYLPITVTSAGGPNPTPSTPIGAAPPPPFARRSVVGAVALTLVLSAAGWIDWQYGGGLECPHIPFLGHVNVRSIEGQCIGYSDSSYFRFNDKPGQDKLRAVQDTIFEQNTRARDTWEQGNRARPYVTIVYLGTFTGRDTNLNEEAYSAEREELEGLAVAQYEGIWKSGSNSEPLLNIVIANAGREAKHVDVAVDMLERLAAEDPKVVGVVGLVESRTTTAKALEDLNEIGLPAISTTLSADNFDDHSRLYLQLSAPNMEQATMMAAYASQVLHVSRARIYWTTGKELDLEKDLYVKTLIDDLGRIFPTVDHNGRFDGSLSRVVCGYQGVVIFAGRWSEFTDFLGALNECGPNRPSHVIANDSVSRYMANPKLRESASSTIPITYVSKSTLASCERLRGAQDRGESLADQFFKSIQKAELLHPRRCGQENEPAGERISLAYDSARLILDAVKDLGLDLRRNSLQEWNPRSIVPVAVHVKILEQVHQRPFNGVSGTIEFEEGSGEPVGRRISLLQVKDVSDINSQPVEVFHCGRARPDDNPACRQP